jgi:hypothetical protein
MEFERGQVVRGTVASYELFSSHGAAGHDGVGEDVAGLSTRGSCKKHPLALVEGSTENATLVTGLLVGLRERGMDVTRPVLVGLDGSKARRKAVVDGLDHPVIQRC